MKAEAVFRLYDATGNVIQRHERDRESQRTIGHSLCLPAEV